jgi:hypothetical protein
MLPLLLSPRQSRVHVLLHTLIPRLHTVRPTKALLLGRWAGKHLLNICRLQLPCCWVLLLLLLLQLRLCCHTQHCQCIRRSNGVIACRSS